jgi:hypothetical protein
MCLLFIPFFSGLRHRRNHKLNIELNVINLRDIVIDHHEVHEEHEEKRLTTKFTKKSHG